MLELLAGWRQFCEVFLYLSNLQEMEHLRKYGEHIFKAPSISQEGVLPGPFDSIERPVLIRADIRSKALGMC